MAESNWEVLDDELPLLAATYGGGRARMVAVGLEGGGLAVVSPGTRAADAREALRDWGSVRYLLAPNAFHNAGLAEWKAHYPDAEIVAHARAQRRVGKKGPQGVPVGDLEGLRAALPGGVRLVSPPMAKQGETWLAVDRGALHALVVCDAIANLEKAPAVVWLFGFRARLMTNPFFKRVFLTSRKEYKAWLLAELDAHPPNLFLPAHGAILRGKDVANDLRRITEDL